MQRSRIAQRTQTASTVLFVTLALVSRIQPLNAETLRSELDARIGATIAGWDTAFDTPQDGPSLANAVAVRAWGCMTETLFRYEIWDECINDWRILHCTRTTCILPTGVGDTYTQELSEDCEYCMLHPECCGIDLPDIHGDVLEIEETSAAERDPDRSRFALNFDHTIFGQMIAGVDVMREMRVSFHRPAGVPTEAPAQLLVPIHVNHFRMSLGDEGGTAGGARAEFTLDINSPQLGQLFYVNVEQNDGRTPTIDGNIPAAAFDIFDTGASVVTYRHPTIDVDIPAGLDTVQIVFSYSMSSSGDKPLEEEEAFRRGDANDDDVVNVADAIRVLEYLFGGLTTLSCPDAADVNDDGKLDVSDPINELLYLFAGGVTVPAPGPIHCGADPTDDNLDCRSSVSSCST